MSDTIDGFRALKEMRKVDGDARRQHCRDTLSKAKTLAAEHGFLLLQKSEVHYQLLGLGGWLINLYPGNQRIYADPNRAKAPYLRIEKAEWDLIDAVKAAINSGACRREAE